MNNLMRKLTIFDLPEGLWWKIVNAMYIFKLLHVKFLSSFFSKLCVGWSLLRNYGQLMFSSREFAWYFYVTRAEQLARKIISIAAVDKARVTLDIVTYVSTPFSLTYGHMSPPIFLSWSKTILLHNTPITERRGKFIRILSAADVVYANTIARFAVNNAACARAVSLSF